MKFPDTWPLWLDQEHITTWLRHYGEILGLNIRHGTTAANIKYNESTQRYSVELESDEGKQLVNPKHVVLATGLFSDIPIRPTFQGEDSFKGDIYHSTSHKSAAQVPNVKDKNVTIVGCGTSAHDIAQDFVNHGAKSVAMVQRDTIWSAR